MGCFNNHGFYSHLPICYGDDIVLIPCYYQDYGGIPETLHPTTIGGTLLPLSFPIFGKYNDYGFIEDVEEDFNTDALIKAFNVHDLNEMLQLIKYFNRRCNGQYSELVKVVKTSKNEFDIEEAKPVLKLMKTLDDNLPSFSKIFTHSLSRLTYVIELREVYEKMASLNPVEDYISYSTDLTAGQSWDRLKEFAIGRKHFNILNPTTWVLKAKDLVGCVESLRICKRFCCGKEFDTEIIYGNVNIDATDPNVKKYFFDFLGFLGYLTNNGGYLTESSYCNQNYLYDQLPDLIEYKEFELELLKKLKHRSEIDEED